MLPQALAFILLLLQSLTVVQGQYEPTWKSLDSRPLPKWYDGAKVGIFMHWGVFSVPSFGSEWFWDFWQGGKPNTKYVEFMKKNYRPGFTYADFASQFTAEFFDPTAWAKLLQKSGAKYVVLTTKHHEGFTLWPSKRSFNWNAMDVGPRRDLVGSLMNAIRNNTDLHFGLYHSLFEWFNPLLKSDIKTNRSDFVDTKTMPELYELVETYQPDVIWSDGDWGMNDDYWKSKEFLAWLYSHSSVKDTVVVNDRWGTGTGCKHGDFYTCADRYDPGVIQPHKWENCFTIDRHSWGFRRDAKLADMLSIEDIITQIARTISCGGNVLINVGPTHDGRIVPIFEERLTQMGEWLGVNGEAVYGSSPWKYQNDSTNPHVWYTSNNKHVFAIVLKWPKKEQLELGSVKDMSSCELLGYGDVKCGTLSKKNNSSAVMFPSMSEVATRWAWVIKFKSTSHLTIKLLQP